VPNNNIICPSSLREVGSMKKFLVCNLVVYCVGMPLQSMEKKEAPQLMQEKNVFSDIKVNSTTHPHELHFLMMKHLADALAIVPTDKVTKGIITCLVVDTSTGKVVGHYDMSKKEWDRYKDGSDVKITLWTEQTITAKKRKSHELLSK
jgi:hypothetical protein